jgi:hypothetical protein
MHHGARKILVSVGKSWSVSSVCVCLSLSLSLSLSLRSLSNQNYPWIVFEADCVSMSICEDTISNLSRSLSVFVCVCVCV